MNDPELHDDETILIRSAGIFVKSVPFEGILTDKRIILVDRAKNLLPPKEIPLATIKDLQPGENAIRDQTITVSVLAQNDAVRQVILTFSRASGGNRTKERDEWVRAIRKYSASSIGQTIRKSIPGLEPVSIKKDSTKPPKIEIVSSQRVSPPPAMAERTVTSPDTMRPERPRPVVSPSPVVPPVIFGTFCTRCGNRVPDGSIFCNRCGTKIVTPGDAMPAPAVSQPASPAPAPVSSWVNPPSPLPAAPYQAPPRQVAPAPAPAPSPETPQPSQLPPVPAPIVVPKQEPPRRFFPRLFSPKTRQPAPLPDSSQLPQPSPAPEPAAAPKQKPARRSLSRLFSRKTPPPAPQTPPAPASKPHASHQAPEKNRGGKKKIIVIGIAVILVIAIIAGVFLFVKPAFSIGTIITATPSGTTTSAGAETPNPAVGSTVTIARAETTASTIPTTGVYVHVNYIGGWKGTYGLPAALQSMTSSGDRFVNVENATGVIQASFAKQDGSSHEILVEIYKDGKLLTKGITSVPNGKVTLSVDTTTGIAQAPVITGASGTVVASVTTVSPQTTANSTAAVTTTVRPVTTVTH